MSLVFEKVSSGDIQFVVGKLWDRGEKEAAKAGFDSKEQLLAHLLSLSGEYAYALKVEEEPVAVFGATTSNRGQLYYSWFIATDQFNKVGKQATRFLRGFIKERVKGRPDARLEMMSAVDHPEAEKWFKFIGFRKLEEESEGVFSRYIYEEKR